MLFIWLIIGGIIAYIIKEVAAEIRNNSKASKKCPRCFKDVPTRATKCPYCQSNITGAIDSIKDLAKLFGTALLIIFGLVILLFFISPGSNPASAPNSINQNPTTNTPTTPTQSAPKKTATETTEIKYNKISLSEIPNNFVDATNAGIEITATAVKGIKIDDYLFVYLRDKSGYALMHLESNNKYDTKEITTINSVNTGDTITMKALVPKGVNFCSSSKEAESVCVPLGIPTDTPYILPSDIKIVEKSGNPEKLIHIDYSAFQKISDSDYAKNPPAYLNKKIKISDLLVSDFLAAGDRGGDSNYILTLDGTNPLSMTLTLLMISTDGYKKATAALNEGNYIAVYGTGAESHPFTTSLGGTALRPVIKVWRIDGNSGTIFEVNP